MQAESVFEPISPERIRLVRAKLALAGETPAEWAIRNGFKPQTVYKVLSGNRKAIRGISLKIAILIGLRDDPREPSLTTPTGGTGPLLSQPAPSGPLQPHANDVPAGRTVAGHAPVASCDRGTSLQAAAAR